MLETFKEFLLDLTLLQSGTFTMSLSQAINGVGWFLSTLFICYMACPAVAKFLKNNVKSVTKNIMLLVGVIFILLGLSHFFNGINGQYIVRGRLLDDFCYGSPLLRIWYVVIGMILAKIHILLENKKSDIKNGTAMELLSVCVVIFYILTRNSMDLVLGKRLLDVVICAEMLLIISLGKGKISEFLSKPYLVELGKKTMFIYLLHYPIRHYMVHIVFKNVYWGEITGIVISVVIVIVSVAISSLMSKLYDRLRKA